MNLNIRSINKKLFKNMQLFIGLIVLVVVALTALLSAYLATYSPTDIDVLNRFKPPSVAHPFGTDGFGRDVFSRVIYGSRTSLLTGILTMFFTLLLGGLIVLMVLGPLVYSLLAG